MFDLVPFRKNNGLRRRDSFEGMLDSFFNDDFFNGFPTFSKGFNVDLRETDSQYIIEADLPGVNKDSLNIYYENNYLTISAKREDILEDNSSGFIRRERSYGEFSRAFYVDNIDENSIDASFNNGVLNITMNKLSKVNPNRRSIDIH